MEPHIKYKLNLLLRLKSNSKIKSNKDKMDLFIPIFLELRQLESELAKLTQEYEIKLKLINITSEPLKKLLMQNCIHYANPNSISWSKIWDVDSYYNCPACDYKITDRTLTNIWDENAIINNENNKL
jgi:hypothetical protein